MRIGVFLLVAGLAAAQGVRTAAPAGFTGGPAIDAILEAAIRADAIPGAVVAVGHRGQIVYQKAYGSRALVPRREAMTLDTIFDVASLTKVIATTSSIMKLVERGQLRLNEKVTTYLPEFQGGRSDMLVRHLLIHYSGMRPDLDLEPEWSGYETGVAKALADLPTGPPDKRFVYSDINFILLGEIVHRISGKMLPEFAAEEIFGPLRMTETQFLPPASLRPRIAPTEMLRGMAEPLRGIVHDPTTRAMGGIAGHAGLFSTVGDLSRFALMMLADGEADGVRIFSPLTIDKFTSPQSPPQLPDVRGFGWDIDSRFSGNRGDLFPIGSYGHTGFTGTSLWIDPFSKSFVILLSNSGHPKLRSPITSLRGRVASAAAAGLQLGPMPPMPVRTPQQRPARPRRR